MAFKRKRKQERTASQFRPVGWVFTIILLLILLAAWNTGTNLLYIVFGGVLSFMVLSSLASRWTLKRLKLTREAPYAVDRGQAFPIHVRIENHKRWLPSISVRVEGVSGEEGGHVSGARGYILKVPAQRAAILDLQDVFHRRGVHKLPPLQIISDFPFGITERSLVFEDKAEIIVYPRVQTVRTTGLDQMAGGRQLPRSASGDGDEFFSLREYVVGDDVRHIVWRLSARMNKWMVREMTVQHSRFVALVLDTRRPMDMDAFDDHFEDAVDLVASLAVSLLHRHFSVSIHTPGHRLEFGDGTAHEHQALELLARVEATASADCPDFDSAVQALESQPISVLYISPDPRLWGVYSPSGKLRILDPRELVHG